MLIQLWADKRPARSKEKRKKNNTIHTEVSKTFEVLKTSQYLKACFTKGKCIPQDAYGVKI